MRRKHFSFVCGWVAFLAIAASWSALAQPGPQPGRVKVLLGRSDGTGGVAEGRAASLDAEEVAVYRGYRLISLPEAAIERLPEMLHGTGLTFTVREDFDILSLPGGRIDTRQGLDPSIPDRRLLSGYPDGTTGLYVIQLIGPSLPEWIRQIEDAGAEIVSYVPQNGYLIGTTAGGAAAVRDLPFVQWFSLYHPFHKGIGVDPAGGGLREVEVEIADIESADEAISEVRRLDPSARERVRFANRIIVRARIPAGAVSRLLEDGRVMGVSARPEIRPSDERQAMAVSGNVDPTGNQPSNPGTYRDWLHTLCPFCANLAAEGFVVGVADTGLDAGPAGSRHADLAQPASRMSWGQNFTSEGPQDNEGHGTMVAGIIAGDASTGARDENGSGFYLGMGIAPTAGIRSTKVLGAGVYGSILAGQTASDPGWAYDATDGVGSRAWIQNHSRNSYGLQVEGRYTPEAAEYDEAVRDSNSRAKPGGSPITLIVSSGNQAPPNLPGVLTAPPAMAKNVIAVGGAETFRPAPLGCKGADADGFRNLMRMSRHGSRVRNLGPDGQPHAWSTYIKPDLVAVGSDVVSTRTTAMLSPLNPPCQTSFQGDARYMADSGTSFAAPVAAGAALLASRVYSEHASPGVPDPRKASPALLKAMLIGTARSMEGGLDKTGATFVPIGPRPNDVQGFGLVSITDLLDPNAARSYINQTHRFTSPNDAVWNAIYYRRDTTKPVRVALTWTDPVGATDPADPKQPTAPTVPPLVNNLDLEVHVPFSQNVPSNPTPCDLVFWGNNLEAGDRSQGLSPCLISPSGLGHDFRNNAELVVLQPEAGSPFSMLNVAVLPAQIQAQADPAGPPTNQDFALFVFNASQRGDFNHEGKTDLVWRHVNGGNPALWFGASPASYAYLEAIDLPWRIEAVGDFDHNGSDDFVLRNASTGEVQIRRMNKTAHIGTVALPPTGAGSGWEVQGAGDFNRDGHLDIVWRNYGNTGYAGQIVIWHMFKTSFSSAVFLDPVPALSWHIEGVADFDGDARPDLLWHDHAGGDVVIWFMNGAQRVDSRAYQNVPRSAWRVGAVGDFNEDGFNDIVWRDHVSGSNVVWFLRQGLFSSSAALPSNPDLHWEIVGPR